MLSKTTCLFLSFILMACGGSTSESTSSKEHSNISQQNAVNTGFFINPFADELVQGNLLITYSVSSSGTIEELQLRFGTNTNGVLLCKGETVCETQLADTVSGINPRDYGAVAGIQEVSLWIINTSGQTTKVATQVINWQPREITNLVISRSTDGSSVTVDWPLNESLARYNVYLAANSGVNKTNFTTLPEGQARLAVVKGPIEFSDLLSDTAYYIMVTGIDGSGESAFSTEHLIDSVNSYPDLPNANDDKYDAIKDTALVIPANQGLLINDNDPLEQTIFVQPTLIQAPSNGQITVQASGAFEYTPNANFLGNDNFTYQLENSVGGTAQANVIINVASLKIPISGNSITINGKLRYSGLGEELPLGSNIGTGRYSLGNCVQYIDTICTVIGDYKNDITDDIQGRYAFTFSYNGVGVSPVIAHSVAAGSNVLSFTDVGDAIFELSLFPDSGGIIVGQFPEPDFSQSINFGATIINDALCQNLPFARNCTIAETGMSSGAELVASLDLLSFDIPSSSLGTGANHLPSAADDQYQTATNTPLIVGQPGVLLNDEDGDFADVGDQLSIYNQFNPAMGSLVALGYDEYRQLSYLYSSEGTGIYAYDRSGEQISTLDLLGEVAVLFDIEVASQSFQMNNTLISQGSIISINGETDVAEIYALHPENGVLLAELTTAFGNGSIVGGTYNTKTNSFFLLQDRFLASGSDSIAEINAQTGNVINTFPLNDVNHSFNAGSGDIASDPITGNLYIVSSIVDTIDEYSSNGDFIRSIDLPIGVNQVSGIEISDNGRKIWLSSSVGEVFELSFNNAGELPRFVAEIKKQPNNGSVTLNTDGSFTYTPNSGFTGRDSFDYLCHDQNGGVSAATVFIDIN